MKVVHISAAITGGAGIAAFRIHSGLLSRKDISSFFVQKFKLTDKSINKHVFQCDPYYPTAYRLKKKFHITEDDLYRKEIEKFPRNYEIFTLPVAPFRIEDHHIVKEADIIHLHWVADFLNYPSFFENVKQPLVWTLHDMNPFQGIFHYEEDTLRNKSTLGKLDQDMLNKKIAAIHQKNNITIVSPSDWLKNKSKASEAFKQYPHRLIPYGLDFNLYPLLDRQQEKEKQSVNNGRKTILFVAHFTDIYRKGFDLLQKAINDTNLTDVNIISVGGKKMHINDKVNHIHYESIEDISFLNSIYSAADITILPSREDNLPNVMVESLANGTPVISFTNGGMAEHIKTGKNGILIKDIGWESLANGIENFLSGKYSFDSPEQIREYPLNQLNSELEADRYIQLYKDILG